MNIIFLCNQGMHRSRTAAELFSGDFAGIYNNVVTTEQLAFADIIVVMEEHQRSFIAEHFPELYLKKRIVSLDIPDIYQYRQPELCALLEERIRPLLELE